VEYLNNWLVLLSLYAFAGLFWVSVFRFPKWITLVQATLVAGFLYQSAPSSAAYCVGAYIFGMFLGSGILKLLSFLPKKRIEPVGNAELLKIQGMKILEKVEEALKNEKVRDEDLRPAITEMFRFTRIALPALVSYLSELRLETVNVISEDKFQEEVRKKQTENAEYVLGVFRECLPKLLVAIKKHRSLKSAAVQLSHIYAVSSNYLPRSLLTTIEERCAEEKSEVMRFKERIREIELEIVS
jgi:hypothetical protein